MEGGVGNPDHAGLERRLSTLERALARAPSEAAPHARLGGVLAELGRIDEARAAFGRATELAPQEVWSWKALAQLEVKAGNWPAVVRTERRAIQLGADDAHANANLCWALRSLGRLEEAIAAGRRAVELEPDSLIAHDYLGFAYLAADDCRNALECCRIGVRLGPRKSMSLALLHAALDGLGRREEARAIADFESFIWLAPPPNPPRGFPTLDAFNDALAQASLAAPTRPLDDKQTGDLLADPVGPMAGLREIIDDAVHLYARHLDALPERGDHPFVRHLPTRWEVNGWATRFRGAPALEHHIHYKAWLSGVYYVRVPGFVGAPERGHEGFLEFCRFPQFSARKVESEFAALPPKEGMMVLFPGYFYHRISPFSGPEIRISLAFNVEAPD